jgi:integrase
MASLVWDDGKRARILFWLDDRRKAVRLGKVPTKVADEWKRRVEEMVANLVGGVAPDANLAVWLRDLPDDAHEKLSRVGLVAERVREDKPVRTLKALCDAFKGRAAVKASTAAAYGQAVDSLTAFFGEDRDVATITTEHADEWKKAISTATAGEGRRKKKRVASDNTLAPATVAKRINVGKQIFASAVRWKWIGVNPFGHLRAGSQANPARNHYVDLRTTEAVLDACPGFQWQALIGLCRYAGLRCPSEVGLLRWVDVDFNHGRLQVRSPKTEGHGAEHAVRLVPIVPRLRTILSDAFAMATPGEVLVVPMAARAQANLRTTMTKVIERAHCRPWPRLFQNLRASCETDWVQNYPAHTCAKWLGHSPRIAAEHYLMARDHHFHDAVRGEGKGTAERGAKCGAIGAPNAAPRASATVRKESQDESETEVIPEGTVVSPLSGENCQKKPVGSTGFEPVTSTV